MRVQRASWSFEALVAAIAIVLALATMVMASSCAPSILRLAEARNPGCRVVPLEQEGHWARVRVICPGRMPVEREYGKRPE